MKYYVKKSDETAHSAMTFDELQEGFKARRIAADSSVRREDDREQDWVTVQQMMEFGVSEPTARTTLNWVANRARRETNLSKRENRKAISIVGGIVIALLTLPFTLRLLPAHGEMSMPHIGFIVGGLVGGFVAGRAIIGGLLGVPDK